MKATKDKTMTVKIVQKPGIPENVGVMIGGEICKPGQVVTVPLSTGRNLIHRERAVTVDSGKASAKTSGKASV